ncbi:MAG TPA: PAS domain S-box protein, partial [Methanoregula sp.]|nr:PAS domain S-box protein [Methanoregula sp.]
MDLFTVLESLCILSAFTTCALGFFVFAKNPVSRINCLFLASMLGATYWALGEFLLWNAGTADGALFWLKASALWPVVIVVTVHFVLAFTDHPLARPGKSPVLLIALYLLGGVFSLVGLFTGFTHTIVSRGGDHYGYAPLSASPVYLAESLFILVIIFSAIAAGITAWRHAVNPKNQNQVKYICLGISATIIFGALSGIILPALGIYLPNLVFIGIVLFSLCITYAVTRFGMFTLSAETAVPSILRAMPDGLILMGMDGQIILANSSAARIFRTEQESLVGQHADAFLPARTYDVIIATISESESFDDLEADLDFEKSTVVSIAGSLVKDPAGNAAGIVLIIRDISSRKMEERALRVANEKISLLTHLTRHDINNLVTGLSGYLLLLEKTNTTPPGNQYVKTAADLVEKVSQHLRFSSEYLNLGTYTPDWQPLPLRVSGAVNDVPHEGITITTDIQKAEIYADPLSVKAIYNLLENALRHGKDVTEIRIQAHEQDSGQLLLVVEDNGGGIAPEEKEEI